MGTILTRRTGRPQGEAVQAPCRGDQRRGTQLWGRSSAWPSGHPSETSGSICWRLLATREGQSGPLNGVLGDNSYAAWSQKTKEVRKVSRIPLRRRSGQHPVPAEALGGGRSAPGLPTVGKGRLTCRHSPFCTLLPPGPSSEAVPRPKCPGRGSSALLPGAHPPRASTLSFVLELLALPPCCSLSGTNFYKVGRLGPVPFSVLTPQAPHTKCPQHMGTPASLLPAQTSILRAGLFGSVPLPLAAGMCDQKLQGNMPKATSRFPHCPWPSPLYRWQLSPSPVPHPTTRAPSQLLSFCAHINPVAHPLHSTGLLSYLRLYSRVYPESDCSPSSHACVTTSSFT